MNGLVVRPSPGKGRGIFAEKDFAQGDLIERCPVLLLPAEQRPLVAKTKLDTYYFNWVKDSEIVAICLGYGSIYNHSETPNATFFTRPDHYVIDFVALTPIRAGEEVTHDYRYMGQKPPSWYRPAVARQESPAPPE